MQSLISFIVKIVIVYAGTSALLSETLDYKLKEPVTLHCRTTPLREILNDLSKQIRISFVYRDSLVKDIIVSYDVENGLFEDVLTHLIPAHRLSYQIIADDLIVLIPNNKGVSSAKSENITHQKFQSPQLIYKTEHVYPPEAIYQNASGMVNLHLRVNSQGKVDFVLLKNSSGFALLDSTAVTYANQFRSSHVQQ